MLSITYSDRNNGYMAHMLKLMRDSGFHGVLGIEPCLNNNVKIQELTIVQT
jgi:hypothetical protein